MHRSNAFAMAIAFALACFALLVTSAPATNTLEQRAGRIVTTNYTVIYYDEPSSGAASGVFAEGTLAATASTTFMNVVVCTGPLIYYGECMMIQIDHDGCIDLIPDTKFDNTISSVEVLTQNALCMVWTGHRCIDGDSTWLNEGDQSRDRVKFAPWNDTVSSLGCYWDPRGVTGTWESGYA